MAASILAAALGEDLGMHEGMHDCHVGIGLTFRFTGRVPGL
jgi:hypothetical protein